MARARNKAELLEFGEETYTRLLTLLRELSEHQRTKIHVFENRTVKDLVAHLHAWHELFLSWYRDGMTGGKPQLPAPGFTWKDRPKLNETLYKKYQGASWEEILKSSERSHKEVMAVIKKHSDKELTTKKKYAWTGSTNLATYLAGATSSHYSWAIGLIKKFKKSRV